MFRWLPEGEGSERDRVVQAFRNRLAALSLAGEEHQLRVGKALSLIFRDFERESGGLDAYAAADRPRQKDLIVRLVNYEATCREEDNLAEAAGAELLSYLLAMIAAKDTEGEHAMSRPMEELAKIGDPAIRMRATRRP